MVHFYFKLDSSSVLLPSKVEKNSMKFHFVKAQIKWRSEKVSLQKFLFSEVLNGGRAFTKLNALAEPLPVLRRPKNQQH